ncbi:MAG: hypothetical protein SFY70_01810 [Bacteroidia bacterium]|nr:hypothetical protein [Bacteroidia bacterium]
MKELLRRIGIENPLTTLPGIVLLAVASYVAITSRAVSAETVALFTLGTGLIAAKDGRP